MHTVYHILVVFEHPHEVGAQSGLVSDLLKKPYVAIEPVLVRIDICRASRLFGSGQTFALTHIPVIRKDEFCPFLQAGKDTTLPGDELLVLVNDVPMALDILTFSVLVNSV